MEPGRRSQTKHHERKLVRPIGEMRLTTLTRRREIWGLPRAAQRSSRGAASRFAGQGTGVCLWHEADELGKAVMSDRTFLRNPRSDWAPAAPEKQADRVMRINPWIQGALAFGVLVAARQGPRFRLPARR